MIGLGWMQFAAETPQGVVQLHLMPADDIRSHQMSAACPCVPREDDSMPGFWAHNAWDRREEYEAGRKVS